jgi:opacity protein-like surface antigen
MKKLLLFLSSALLIMTTHSNAENNHSEPSLFQFEDRVYWGIGYANFQVEVDNDNTYHAWNFVSGYKFNPYFSTEFRYIYGSNDDFTGTNKAFYLKPIYPIDQTFSIYALLGYGEVVARQSSGSGVQYGLGVEYIINKSFSVTGDYIHHYNDTLEEIDNIANNHHDSTLTSFSITFNYHF